MPAYSLSPWGRFVARWENCSQCPLHEVRRHIVLARGRIPCDVLFVGEAPGSSEDVLGVPFVGPAGKLLDRQIAEALENSGKQELRIAFTNLVCCIPKEGKGGSKTGEPSKESIEACDTRLTEMIELCQPRIIVCVGDLSAKWLKDVFPDITKISITHPAAILRAEIVRQSLMDQRVVVVIESAFRDLV
jgi:DNA polymerase